MKLERFAEAKQDCDAALKMEPNNKKAFYRRALAHKGLKVRSVCPTDTNASSVEARGRVKSGACNI